MSAIENDTILKLIKLAEEKRLVAWADEQKAKDAIHDALSGSDNIDWLEKIACVNAAGENARTMARELTTFITVLIALAVTESAALRPDAGGGKEQG